MVVTYNVKLKGSDGNNYVISYEDLKADLDALKSFDEKNGWNNVTRHLREDVNKLEESLLAEILIPKAKQAILEFLKDNPNVKTRAFYHKAWETGYRRNAWDYAKEELEADGIIVSESHGKSKNRTWKIKLDLKEKP